MRAELKDNWFLNLTAETEGEKNLLRYLHKNYDKININCGGYTLDTDTLHVVFQEVETKSIRVLECPQIPFYDGLHRTKKEEE